MVDIKTSTKNAVDFFNAIYPERHNGILLEEIELSDDEKYWLITLGYNVENPDDVSQSPLSSILSGRVRRGYKTFKVDRNTGEVRAMKIRTV